MEFSVENAEIMENCPWKMIILSGKLANYCCNSRFPGVESEGATFTEAEVLYTVDDTVDDG